MPTFLLFLCSSVPTVPLVLSFSWLLLLCTCVPTIPLFLCYSVPGQFVFVHFMTSVRSSHTSQKPISDALKLFSSALKWVMAAYPNTNECLARWNEDGVRVQSEQSTTKTPQWLSLYYSFVRIKLASLTSFLGQKL